MKALSRVSAILLAAGKSRRMGVPKQLLTWRGSTSLEQVIDNLLGPDVAEVIVVLGYEAEEIAPRIAHRQSIMAPVYKGIKGQSQSSGDSYLCFSFSFNARRTFSGVTGRSLIQTPTAS